MLRRTPPGREWRVTAAWEAELVRVIELNPYDIGVSSANWTIELLAEYLGKQTGIQVTKETVRMYLHAHGRLSRPGAALWSVFPCQPAFLVAPKCLRNCSVEGYSLS